MSSKTTPRDYSKLQIYRKVAPNNYSHLFSAPKWSTVEDEYYCARLGVIQGEVLLDSRKHEARHHTFQPHSTPHQE